MGKSLGSSNLLPNTAHEEKQVIFPNLCDCFWYLVKESCSSTQKYIQSRSFQHSHHLVLLGQPQQRRTYDSSAAITTGSMWPKLLTIFSTMLWVVWKRRHYRHQQHLKLISAYGPLELVVGNIFRLQPESSNKNSFINVMTDMNSKPTHASSESRTPGVHCALTFIDNKIMPYGIFHFLLPDNDCNSGTNYSNISVASQVSNIWRHQPIAWTGTDNLNDSTWQWLQECHDVNEHQSN